MLRGLNALYGFPLSEDALLAAGRSLGADVPFCLRGGTRLCEGIGDEMTEIETGCRLELVVAKAGEGVSTPEMYALYDAAPTNFHPDAETMAAALRRGDTAAAGNVFEPLCIERRPMVAALRERLEALGALRACMSGSGPAVFGIFPDSARARKAAETLREQGIFAAYCRSSPCGQETEG